MKSIQILAGGILILLSLSSCGNSEGKSPGNSGLEAVLSSPGKSADSEGDNTCLLSYQDKYDKLLSENDVISATGFSKGSMETKYSRLLKNPEHHEFLFKFKNGRIAMIPALKRKMEIQDVIAVRSIKPMSLNMFKQNYQAISDQMIKETKATLNEVAEGNSGGSDAEYLLHSTGFFDSFNSHFGLESGTEFSAFLFHDQPHGRPHTKLQILVAVQFLGSTSVFYRNRSLGRVPANLNGSRIPNRTP